MFDGVPLIYCVEAPPDAIIATKRVCGCCRCPEFLQFANKIMQKADKPLAPTDAAMQLPEPLRRVYHNLGFGLKPKD